MIDTADETLDGFLARLASDAPAPGGGAAAALAVALAAALVAMVCRVTRRRQPDAPATMDETARDADRLRDRALQLSAEDSHAYAKVLQARRQPAADAPAAMAEALKGATDVPLATAGAGRDVLAAAAEVAVHARASVVNDLGVAATLAWAALEAGAATARVNLGDVEDEAYVARAYQTLARLIDEGATLRGRVAEVIAGRA